MIVQSVLVDMGPVSIVELRVVSFICAGSEFKDIDFAKDYYRILGVNRSSTAKEIQTAYRTLAKEKHPVKLCFDLILLVGWDDLHTRYRSCL